MNEEKDRLKSLVNDEKGAVMVEFAMVFPFYLLVLLGIVQMSLIFIAKNVVTYAAYTATRAQIVGEDPNLAAAAVCAPITGTSYKIMPPGITPYIVPGWGEIPNSDIAQIKTHVDIIDDNFMGDVTAEVTFDFELYIPFINYLYYKLALETGDWDEASEQRQLYLDYGEYHYPIKARWTAYKPWGAPINFDQLHPNILSGMP